jgi:hypothetical protein
MEGYAELLKKGLNKQQLGQTADLLKSLLRALEPMEETEQ